MAVNLKVLKRYDKYKDSGIEWIGKIPQHWEICKLLKLFKDRKCPNKGNVENNVLSLSYGNIKRRNTETNIGLLPESFESYNIIEPNNIVLRLTDLQNDHKSLRCGLVKERGIITSAYITLELKDSKQSANYFYRLLHTFDIEKGFYGMGAGVRQSLKFEGELCNLYIIKPPVLEQQQIADYLDKKCGEIDEVIDKQKAVIEKLKEYKQSIITEAVTKGLDKSVPLKDSGIEWIGKIPQHWQIKKLKFITNCNTKVLDEKTPSETIINYIEIGSVTNENGINDFQTMLFENSPSRARRIVTTGDTILSTVRTYLKAIAYIDKSYDNFICSTGFAVFTPMQDILPKFLFHALHSEWFVSTVEANSVGISYPAINTSNIMNYKISVPAIEEQEQILKYLDKKCIEIDSAISDKEQLIEKLTEYKKSLIYECVTGKRKVVA